MKRLGKTTKKEEATDRGMIKKETNKSKHTSLDYGLDYGRIIRRTTTGLAIVLAILIPCAIAYAGRLSYSNTGEYYTLSFTGFTLGKDEKITGYFLKVSGVSIAGAYAIPDDSFYRIMNMNNGNSAFYADAFRGRAVSSLKNKNMFKDFVIIEMDNCSHKIDLFIQLIIYVEKKVKTMRSIFRNTQREDIFNIGTFYDEDIPDDFEGTITSYYDSIPPEIVKNEVKQDSFTFKPYTSPDLPRPRCRKRWKKN